MPWPRISTVGSWAAASKLRCPVFKRNGSCGNGARDLDPDPDPDPDPDFLVLLLLSVALPLLLPLLCLLLLPCLTILFQPFFAF